LKLSITERILCFFKYI